MKHPKPEPVIVSTLCSLCNERWEDHGDDASTLDCIRLLRAALLKRPNYTLTNQPWTYPLTYGNTTSTGLTTINTSASAVVYMTPRTDDGPDPIGAAA